MNIDHLADSQIEDLLIGAAENRGGILTGHGAGRAAHDEAQRHLESCRLCGAKKEGLEQALLLYREAALAVTNDAGERAAASTRAMTVDYSHAAFAHRLFWGWRARAFALVLLLAVFIPVFVARERERREAQEISRNHLLVEEQAKQATDDLLLQQVDQEITESVPQPLQSLTQLVVDNGTKNGTQDE